MKMCMDCKTEPCLKMKVARNSEYFPRCLKCHRKHNKQREARRRLGIKRKALLGNAELAKSGWRICSACFRKKTLSEFSRIYKEDGGKLHALCDTCLTHHLAANRKDMDTFSPRFWRRRAYSCNSTYRNRLKRLKLRIVPLGALEFIIKPQDLLGLYQRQNGLCLYCKVPLTPSNMAADHSNPVSKNGIHHIDNIRLTCSDCNTLKQDRNNVEFLSFIRDYSHRLTQALEPADKEPQG